MSGKPKCSRCNERDAFAKGLCSRCYSRKWQAERKAAREVELAPKQLTSGPVEAELLPPDAALPETHLVACNPVEMHEARGDLKAWVEQKLATLARDIVEANAALNEARNNNWGTAALTSARNRAVDDETFYFKVLQAVEAGHTIIPEFPIEIFAVRRHEADRSREVVFNNAVNARDTFLGEPVRTDCAPAGAGEYRNPQPWTSSSTRENLAPGAKERNEPRWYTSVYRSANPVGPISFPSMTARSPIMRATAKAMKEKVFDQIGVCHPVIADAATATRRTETSARRAGDPLVIGQILHKRVGSKQKCVSFIIAWYLNVNEL